MKNALMQLESVLSQRGCHAGLEFLNERVDHRFTAIYRLDNALMKNVDLVDKERIGLPDLQEVPLGNSFCQYALRDGQFLTSASGDDRRLDGHPYQGVVGSYVGLPLLGNDGELWGTFCHFDIANRPIQDEEFDFLQKVARLLPRYMPR
jgi:GAF domain-containing protein